MVGVFGAGVGVAIGAGAATGVSTGVESLVGRGDDVPEEGWDWVIVACNLANLLALISSIDCSGMVGVIVCGESEREGTDDNVVVRRGRQMRWLELAETERLQ